MSNNLAEIAAASLGLSRATAVPLPRGNVAPASRKPTARSRVSNGKQLFLEGVDGRTPLVRRYRDVLAELVSDLGGDPSEAQSLIARRAATLAVWCEQAEAEMAAGRDFDVSVYATSANALRRLLADLGLERRARDAGAASIEERRRRLEEARAIVERRAPAIVVEAEIAPAGASEASP
jgi:hypothetical protein